MMKVLYITNLPAPYKISFFQILAQKVELTVAYERKNAVNQDKKWINPLQEKQFEEIYLHGIKTGTDTVCSFDTIKLLKQRRFDTVIMNGFSSPTAIMTITYMKLCRIPYGIACDGMLHNPCGKIKQTLKRFLISNADYYLSPNDITTDILGNFGADTAQVYRYPFSSVLEKEVAKAPYDREIYKKKIGWENKKVVLFIGQFIYRKGIDILMKAFKQIANTDCHLILTMGRGI